MLLSVHRHLVRCASQWQGMWSSATRMLPVKQCTCFTAHALLSHAAQLVQQRAHADSTCARCELTLLCAVLCSAEACSKQGFTVVEAQVGPVNSEVLQQASGQ